MLQDASDLVVLLTTQDIPSIKNARLFLDLSDALGIERRRILFVMNRFDKRIGITPEKVRDNFKQEVAAVLPLDERTVIPSVNRGVPFFINNKSQPVARAVISLAEAVRQRISELESVEEDLAGAPRALAGRMKKPA
jgi:pilus assembly protein CpaE